ncbi:glycosyltransferase family 4 protein [Mucilaginibacter pocheonensis]|uniref:Glycosyltransferase involved in cell wall biosynthesis n=1 Tax=Mucilaginibacter pocheonensis TaxID=398050 RepID=A0ABU1TCR1_9SPHI|nr:glycosyltransferase family 1 protein [Mucilaginibacter pocheonensis]MDR6943180.1 glycosyltransferase involved in cell wall biosynthesis [Mucilaginibacter pocheonensis]
MKYPMFKIAFISEHASPLASLGGVDTGGQNVYVSQLAQFLTKHGYHIDIYTRRDDHMQKEVVNWRPGIRVIHVNAGPKKQVPKEELLPYMDEFGTNMLAFMEEQHINYDLIHANFFMSAVVAAQIKETLDIPYVVTFHALGYIRTIYQGSNDRFPPERVDIEKEVARKADYVIAECPQDRDDLLQHYQIEPEKIVIIPCGFSEREFYPINKGLARKFLNLQADVPVLLQLGRMVPRKGVDNVIKGIAKLKMLGKRARLVIVGGEADLDSCPEIARLKKIAAEGDILDDIHFAGRQGRDKLKFYYAAADVFITTPWYEPFGITPLEAMACGTPVIGSNVGGIKYTVIDGETGALVNANDPDQLAEKINELAFDQDKLARLSMNAIKRVNQHFTWESVAHKMSSLYQKMISLNVKNNMIISNSSNKDTKAA